MSPLETWEKVLVDAELFLADPHGAISCTDCHGGQQSTDKDEAHTDLICSPSEDFVTACAECHEDVTDRYEFSLHNTLQGYWTSFERRSIPENHEALTTMFSDNCSACHSTCGDCHVRQPSVVGGGLIDGHVFNKTPSMTRNCTACHGSRVGKEYLGRNEGLRADVHFRLGRMSCVACHSNTELHGPLPQEHMPEETVALGPPNHRYAGLQTPRCEDCHVAAATGQDEIEMHQAHSGDLSCQVCHSLPYANCEGCHVSVSETTGNPVYHSSDAFLTFMIGKNTLQSFDRPYEYVPVRHIPIDRDSYAFYGDDLLPNFDAWPTWQYTTPHNTQLNTPQTESCNACHGNPDLFLTADKVDPDLLEANRPVIVETIPEPIPDDE